MSGITHLYDIYNKKGKEFTEILFNSFVTINEKMDGSSFIFERSLDDGNFIFYKRDQKNPITLVDRTLMKYYELPINYIQSLPPNIVQKIPRGWKFGLEYFSNTKPVEIVYDTLPKNNLILSYVHTKFEGSKVKDTIQNKEMLDGWADILGIERPPIIFQGYLSDKQKSEITGFLNTQFSDLVKEYKTKSFVSFIIGVLNPELKKTALNLDTVKAIEGIVFRFGETGSDSEPILSKMVDPVFTEIAKNKAKNRTNNKPSDFLGITILDVMNFILERGVNTFSSDGKNDDERYVSYISDVFSKFLDENASKYKGADFQEPEYLKRDEFRLNRENIKSTKVLRYLDIDDSFESLYKLILNSFRKIKKRAGGIITTDIMSQFNLLVNDIEKVVSFENNKNEKVTESLSIPSFLKFKDNIQKKVDYLTEENEDTENDDIYSSYNEFISALETIDSVKQESSSVNETGDNEPELKQCNLLIGRFQPFHNGHLKMVKHLYEINKLPSVLAIVHPGHNKSGKSPFGVDVIKKYMEDVINSEDLIDGYIIVNRGLLGVIYGACKESGYSPVMIGAGSDRLADYNKQIDYLKKSGGDFPSNMKIEETPRSNSGTDVRNKLENEDFTGFKKLVPQAVANLYNLLLSNIKNI